MNEYVCGSNICRAFILWGNNVYCTLFSFFYVEREEEEKKNWRKREKKRMEKKNLDPFSACFERKRKKTRT